MKNCIPCVRQISLLYLFLFHALFNVAVAQSLSPEAFDSFTEYLEHAKNDSKCQGGLHALANEESLTDTQRQELQLEMESWITQDDTVLIRAIADLGKEADLESELLALGASEIDAQNQVILAWIPISQVSSLESCSSLISATPVLRATGNIGSLSSQGDAAMFTDNLRKRFDVDGTGVKVGIISTAYHRFDTIESDLVSSGDLPGINNPNGYNQPVEVLSRGRLFEPNEGMAIAEIIHDVAPGAQLYFHNGTDAGRRTFVDAVHSLVEAGCSIIIDDMSYPSSPYFSDGMAAKAVDSAVDEGIIFFTSAGNVGQSSYEASFSPLFFQDSIFVHNFSSTGGSTEFQPFSVPPESTIEIDFQWDDNFMEDDGLGSTPTMDFDIYLLDSDTGEVVSAGNDNNFLTKAASERVGFVNFDNVERNFLLVIVFSNGVQEIRKIKYIVRRTGDLGPDFAARPGENSSTVFGHSNAEGAITIGAANAANTPRFLRDYQLRPFSSVGGNPLLRDKDQNILQTPVIRNKPELVGPDGVKNVTFPNFIGTSAAAPHVAALAALMLEKRPEMTRDQVLETLINTADDMDNPYTPSFDEGFDFATGHGFVVADKAMASLESTPMIYRHNLIDAQTGEYEGVLIDGAVVDLATQGPAFLIESKTNLSESEIAGFGVDYFLTGDDIAIVSDVNAPFQANFNYIDEEAGWVASVGDYDLVSKLFQGNTPFGSEFGSVDEYNISFQVANSVKAVTLNYRNALTNERLGSTPDTLDIADLNTAPLKFTNNIIRTSSGGDLNIGDIIISISGTTDPSNEFPFEPTFIHEELVNRTWENPLPGNYVASVVVLARAGDFSSAGEIVEIPFTLTDSRVQENEISVVAFPNPSNGFITVLVDGIPFEGSIRIFDSSGEELSTSPLAHNGAVDLSPYDPGIYHLEVVIEGEVRTIQVVLE